MQFYVVSNYVRRVFDLDVEGFYVERLFHSSERKKEGRLKVKARSLKSFKFINLLIFHVKRNESEIFSIRG